jgi:uncharacterized membrane protein YkvA (DUF1232 family)
MDDNRIEQNYRENQEKYAKQYSEKGFLRKLPKLAKKGGIKAVVFANVLYYTLKSPTTPWSARVSILGALGYFVSPLDLIPDFVPVMGFADDIVVLELAVGQTNNMLRNYVTPAILKQAVNNTKRVFKNEPIENILVIVNQFGYYEQI